MSFEQELTSMISFLVLFSSKASMACFPLKKNVVSVLALQVSP